MNHHTKALWVAILTADNPFDWEDEGKIAYCLRKYFTNPIDREERRWIRRNVPAWVDYNRVNWAELARNVQKVPA